MCNRYESSEEDEVARDFETDGLDADLWGATVSPLGQVPFIDAGGRARAGQWGMIPPRSATHVPTGREGKRMSTNNARRETMATSWTYRDAWHRGRRCIIPARHWVEPYWGTGRNIWWAFRRVDGDYCALAGLWSEWTDTATGVVWPSFTMVTQDAAAHPLLASMHRPDKGESRSVVLLERQDWDAWLHGTPAEAEAVIRLPARGHLVSGPENPEDEGRVQTELLERMRSAG